MSLSQEHSELHNNIINLNLPIAVQLTARHKGRANLRRDLPADLLEFVAVRSFHFFRAASWASRALISARCLFRTLARVFSLTRVQVAPRVIPVTTSTTSPMVSVFCLGGVTILVLIPSRAKSSMSIGHMGDHYGRNVHLRQNLLGLINDMGAHVSQMQDGDLVARYLLQLPLIKAKSRAVASRGLRKALRHARPRLQDQHASLYSFPAQPVGHLADGLVMWRRPGDMAMAITSGFVASESVPL